MKDISPENITFPFLRKNNDITFLFGRIKSDAMESVLLSMGLFPSQNELTMNIMQNAGRE